MEGACPKNWHVACCGNAGVSGLRAPSPLAELARALACGPTSAQARVRKATDQAGGVESDIGHRYGQGASDIDHQQQELFVLVVARLAAGQIRRARFRRDRSSRPTTPSARAEILLLSSSILVPCLRHDGATVWDTLAIAEYLNEIMPAGRPAAGRSHPAGALPLDLRRNPFRLHDACARRCRSISRATFPGFKVWTRAQADIDRICTIWNECLAKSGGPFLFGERSHGGRDVRAGGHAFHDL